MARIGQQAYRAPDGASADQPVRTGRDDQHGDRHPHQHVGACGPAHGLGGPLHPAPAGRAESQLRALLAPEQLVLVPRGVVRQQALPRPGGLAGLLAHLPGGAAGGPQCRHEPRGGVPHPRGKRGSRKAQHWRDQYQRIRIDGTLGDGAQGKLPAHRVTDQDMLGGRWPIRARLGLPIAPEAAQIVDPVREIADVPGRVIVAQPPRPALSAPVDRGDLPALAEPVFQRLQIFLIRIAAPAQEQQGAARFRGSGPVDAPDFMPVGGFPDRFARMAGNGAAGRCRIGR